MHLARINKAPAGVEIEGMITSDGDVALFYRPSPDDIKILVALDAIMQ